MTRKLDTRFRDGTGTPRWTVALDGPGAEQILDAHPDIRPAYERYLAAQVARADAQGQMDDAEAKFKAAQRTWSQRLTEAAENGEDTTKIKPPNAADLDTLEAQLRAVEVAQRKTAAQAAATIRHALAEVQEQGMAQARQAAADALEDVRSTIAAVSEAAAGYRAALSALGVWRQVALDPGAPIRTRATGDGGIGDQIRSVLIGWERDLEAAEKAFTTELEIKADRADRRARTQAQAQQWDQHWQARAARQEVDA